MTKNNSLILIVLLFAFSANAQIFEMKESIYFDSDKFEIKESEEEKLIQLWDSVSNDSIVSVHISGNTDNSADTLYNIILSKNRCNTVQGFFISKSVNKGVFTINYFGENKPIAENTSDKGKQKNRRVDIRISYVRKETSEVADPKHQEIDPCIGVDTTLILENGTELVFNKCEYNQIKECLQIKSIRTTDEIIENGSQLRTNDNIPLITCGMISICINPECNIQKTCFDYPVKVRFPFPSDDEECLPCQGFEARVFDLNGSGTWTGVNNQEEKIEIVKIGNVKYYQLEIKCPVCGGMKNCDCPRCDKMSKKERRRACPKVKLKLPYNYELIEAHIFVDCPPTALYFTPDVTKLIVRKNVAKTGSKCYGGQHRIKVLAINPHGDTVRVELSPLEIIKHRILFSRCKLKEKDNQKILGMFPGKKRSFYRKYKVRKRDFKRN